MAVSSLARHLSRRGFLMGLGCLGGTLAVSPSQLMASIESLTRRPARIGLLLPRSNIYPALADNLVAGFCLAPEIAGGGKQGAGVEILTEDIGFGSGQAVEKCQLLLHQGVDVIVGLVSSGVVSALRNVVTEAAVPLVVANAGANVLRDDEQSSNIFHHSLGHWASNWALGHWAGTHLGETAVIASSFYDSGYDSLYAFRLGLESAGGSVLDTVVSHVPPFAGDFSVLEKKIRQLNPDFVHASYCGPNAVEFVRAYTAMGMAARMPLIGSAFLTDEAYLEAEGREATGIRTCSAWASNLETEIGRQFISTYRVRTGKTPDAFAVLGFEAGGLIRAALDEVGEDRNGETLTAALRRAEWHGPRGLLRMDPERRASTGPLYLREVRGFGGRLANVAVMELGNSASRDEDFRIVRTSLKTGWLNAYLSV